MDEETYDGLTPWRKVPFWCREKSVTKADLNRKADKWEAQRDSRKRATPSACAEHGYRKPAASRRNDRKIGFRQ